MSKHKEFHLQVKRVAGIKVAGCEDCGGIGGICEVNTACREDMPEHHICPTTELPAHCYDNNKPCPTCAPWRELEKLCWHSGNHYCSKCHRETDGLPHQSLSNPTYTIQTIRAVFESLGEWEGFVEWHEHASYADLLVTLQVVEQATWDNDMPSVCRETYADILTSDTLMLDAAIEFLKGVE